MLESEGRSFEEFVFAHNNKIRRTQLVSLTSRYRIRGQMTYKSCDGILNFGGTGYRFFFLRSWALAASKSYLHFFTLMLLAHTPEEEERLTGERN